MLNLAIAYAQAGKNVVVVDADLRKPAVHLAFGLENKLGLTNFLANQTEWNPIIKQTHIDHLSIITSGPLPQSPTEFLASKRMNSLLAELKQNYDMVLIDTPSALMLSDAKIVASKCDGVLLVVEYGKVKRAAAKRVKEELAHVKAKLLGVVLNKISIKDAEAYFY